jgi:hypothetical protein
MRNTQTSDLKMESVVFNHNFGGRGKTAVSFLLLFAILWGTGWWLYRPLVPYGSDTGLRFIQIRELIANGWQTLAVSYPGRLFDPELNHVPYYFAYSLVEKEIFLEITPFMPWLASWGYATLGVAGMMLVPALGGILTAVAIYRLAQLSQLPHPHLILWLTVFGTPLFFYSIELWDHTLAAAAAAWAVYWLVKGVYQAQKRWLLLAGMAVGLGLVQRPEMYMFALCLGGGFLLVNGREWRLLLVVAGGGLVTAVPVWLWQYQMVGHPLGMALATHLLGYGTKPALIASSGDNPWFLQMGRKLFVVEARDPHTFVASLSVAIGLVLFLLSVRVEQWQRRSLWWAAAAILLLGYALFLVKTLTTHGLNGVLATFPLIVAALLFVPREVDKRPLRIVYELVFGITFLFLASMVLIWPAYGGLQWSWRYALPFFPLAVYLAFYNYQALVQLWQDWRGVALQRLMVLLVIMTVLLQGAAFVMQVNRHQASQVVRDGVAALPVEVIITNALYLPTEAASLDDRIFLYVEDEAHLPRLIGRFWEQDVTEFAVVPLQFVPLSVPDEVDGVMVREQRPFVYNLSKP